MKPKWTARQIEMAVADHFDIRRNLLIPNVSFGLFKYHEADLLLLYPSGWCSEIEIKVSAQDIKNDLKKKHAHKEKNLRDLWFAVPEDLADNADIPLHAGILSVSRYEWRKRMRYRVVVKRVPVKSKGSRKFTEEEKLKLLRLGCLRIWTLKKKLEEKRK